MTILPLLHTGIRLFHNFTKRIYQGHMLAFFTIAASNERRPLVFILHLKCFPIKGESRLVENISYKGYSPHLSAYAMVMFHTLTFTFQVKAHAISTMESYMSCHEMR